MPKTVMKCLSSLQPDPIQAERHKDTEGFVRLFESVKQHGILQPPGVRADGKVVWGTGRVLAGIGAGIKETLVVQLDKDMTEGEYLLLQWVENEMRQAYTPYQQWLHVLEVKKQYPDLAQKDLSVHLHISEPQVSRILSPSKCSPAWQEALKEGKVKFGDTMAAASLDPDGQAGLLALKLSNQITNRDQSQAHAKRARRGQNGQGKGAKKMKLLIPGRSMAIQVIGEQSFSLSQVLEAIQDLMKELKKAADRCLDPSTFAKLMADLSKPVIQ